MFDAQDDFDVEDGFDAKGKPKTSGHLYMAAPTAESLAKILGLWRRYTSGEKAPYGAGSWWQVFDRLKDLRVWGPQDRVRPEDHERWADLLEGDPEERIKVELEIWFYSDPVKRRAAGNAVSAHLGQVEVEILDAAEIAPISYRAVLASVPRRQLSALLAAPQDVKLLRIDDIQFIRPQSFPSVSTGGEPEPAPTNRPLPDGRPIRGALFDGVPVQNHPLLAGRLVVEDPDGLEARSPVLHRSHGTAMASLILHGDLHENEESLRHRLYVRPLMMGDPSQPDNPDVHERFPPDKLPIPMLLRAVRRMKLGEGGNGPDAPSVVVVNHSLGDAARPFARFASPWARLLDWLAYEYRLLFVVSAGNCADDLPVRVYPALADCRDAPAEQREREIVKALDAQKAARRLLSPAEAMNVLTVGALHRDGQTPPGDAGWRIDPIPTLRSAAVYSRLGLGIRGGVKPEVVEAGGRSTCRILDGDGHAALSVITPSFRGFGQSAAAPPPPGSGAVGHRADSFGTSNAAALVTRSALRVIDALEELREEPGGLDVVRDEWLAVVTKALLAHGALWDGCGDALEDLIEPRRAWQERRNNITRQIGYGPVNIGRVLEGTQHRVTLVGAGDIGEEEARLFSLPVPPALFGRPIRRRVVATLAWLTPVNPNHQHYRRAVLELAPPQWAKTNWPATAGSGVVQPPDKTAAKGTLVHRVFTDRSAIVREENGTMSVAVQCRSPMTLEGRIPFALALTLEVDPAIGAGIDIHAELRNALRVGVSAR